MLNAYLGPYLSVNVSTVEVPSTRKGCPNTNCPKCSVRYFMHGNYCDHCGTAITDMTYMIQQDNVTSSTDLPGLTFLFHVHGKSYWAPNDQFYEAYDFIATQTAADPKEEIVKFTETYSKVLETVLHPICAMEDIMISYGMLVWDLD